MRIGLVVPHIFMHGQILPHVIFSPGTLALDLAGGLQALGAEVTLFSPGPVDTPVRNITADLSLFETELRGRGDTYLDLLKKHPLTFISLARQVQAELIANAYAMANRGELDVVHIYTNEEDLALPMAQLCAKPVIFTHHDPFNFLIKYKNVFPKYKQLPWISMSLAQRTGMPADTNWLANIYHGLDDVLWQPNYQPAGNYVAYFGRIIEPKGAHLAIAAVKAYNKTANQPLQLRIAGKHYAGNKDRYWQEKIVPEIDGEKIIYDGFIDAVADKQTFLGNAQALLAPASYDEPFGMVLIEALACGTPLLGLDSGALPEIIQAGKTGHIVAKQPTEEKTIELLAKTLPDVLKLSRHTCRADFEARFTLRRMCAEHLAAYRTV